MTAVNNPQDAPTTVGELLDYWQMKADSSREMGFEAVARAYEEARRILKAVHWHQMERPMTVEEAAEDTGYSRDHLYDLIRQGKLRNIGEPGRPRVCRADLPRKPNGDDERSWSEAELYSEPI